MDEFIKLKAVSGNIYRGAIYIKLSDIESFGSYYEERTSANGFVQVNGIKHIVEQDEHDIYLAISKAKDKLSSRLNQLNDIKERKEAENFRKTLILEGKLPISDTKKELWLDEEIIHDKSGKNGFDTRVYNAFMRHFHRSGISKVTWRDVYNIDPYTNIRNMSVQSIIDAKNFIERKIEELNKD